MAIFVLTIAYRDHHDWRGYRGAASLDKIIVRADSKQAAYDKAIEAAPWDSPTEGQELGKQIVMEQPDLHPLQNPGLTDCVELNPEGDELVVAIQRVEDRRV